MKILKWALALVAVGGVLWATNWYVSRPSVPTVEQVVATIVSAYRGGKTRGGGTPLVKVSVKGVRDIQRTGYNDFTAIADVTLVFQRDPSIAFGTHNIAAGINIKETVGKDIFKRPRKKGESNAQYLPVGTTRNLRNQLYKITYNKHINAGPVRSHYWIFGYP